MAERPNMTIIVYRDIMHYPEGDEQTISWFEADDSHVTLSTCMEDFMGVGSANVRMSCEVLAYYPNIDPTTREFRRFIDAIGGNEHL